jgi:uncharacterized protein (DUF2236 family)
VETPTIARKIVLMSARPAPLSVARPVDAVRTRLAGSIRQLVAGDPSPPQRPPADVEGLLPAEAVARRVHADPSMFVGGLRALFLQTLHPLAMAGVADHSDYRSDPWGRLRRTGRFVGVTTFGPRDDALEAIARVRRIHDRVVGIAPDGRSYAATDPHLLAWVHVTEVDSFLVAYQRYGATRLTVEEADRYVDEMAVVARLLGAEPVPRDVAANRSWLAARKPELRVGRQARDAVAFLLAPPVALAARPAYSLVSAAAIGLLPPWARRKLWLPSPPLVDPLVVRPAMRTVLAGLGWALDPGPDRPEP